MSTFSDTYKAPKIVQAYGAGVQSCALLRLIIDGKVPRPDLVVFADTQAEPEAVYEVVERDSKLCAEHGIEFETVTWRDLKKETDRTIKVPLFTVNDETGKKGMLWRNCTSRFKIEPIEKTIRLRGWKKTGVVQYMGISMDEIQRMKPSRKLYIELAYPLIDLRMNRQDCLDYLASKGIEGAKSACVFCPYRNKENWEITKSVPADLAVAVQYDKDIRNARKHAGYTCYVHSSRKPLEEALEMPSDATFDDECEGYCGV
jgi:hypothetical protein